MCATSTSLNILRSNRIYNVPYNIILRKSSDIAKFKQDLASAKNIAFLSGAGISLESGIPTFRGPDGYWRKYSAMSLATPAAFRDSPSLVWEFYHHRREVAAKAQPNQALEKIGGAGKDVVDSNIPDELLPHCKKPDCKGLLRPHIVWFGESLETAVFEKADEAVSKCDVCLVIGTSSLVFPAAGFASLAAARGAIVAEFNIETTPASKDFNYYFEGPCATILPKILSD